MLEVALGLPFVERERHDRKAAALRDRLRAGVGARGGEGFGEELAASGLDSLLGDLDILFGREDETARPASPGQSVVETAGGLDRRCPVRVRRRVPGK